MNRRPTIYMRSPMLQIINGYGAGNVSARINQLCERYKELVKASAPFFSANEYVSIFTAMKGYEFDGHIKVEADILPDVLENRGADEDVVKKVNALPFAARVALIDIIEVSI